MPTDPIIIGAALGLTPEHVREAQEEERVNKGGSPEGIAKVFKAMVPTEEERADPYFRKAMERRLAKANKVRKAPDHTARNWTEKDFSKAFGAWATAHGTSTAIFELKVSPGDSLPFDALRPHQKENLLRAKRGKFYHKISDAGNVYGGQPILLPFDSFLVVECKAFVCWMPRIKERGQKSFALIDIEAWDKEEKESDRKSLTWERAGMIGKVCTL